MALTNDEREVIRDLKEQGYSFGEIEGFIASNRAQTPSRLSNKLLQSEPEGRFDDVAEDITSNVKGLGNDLRQRRDNITGALTGRDNPISSGFQIAGNAIGAVGDVAGRAFQTVTQPFLKQSEEERLSDTFGSLVEKSGVVEKYNQLNPETQRNVEAALGITDGFTAGIGAVGTKAATRTLTNTLKTSSRSLEDASRQFASSRVKQSGTAGIRESFDLGLNPDSLMQRVARVSKAKQVKFEERSGQSIGSYLIDRSIFGSPDEIADQLVERVKLYKNRVDRNLSQVEGNFKAPAVKTALDELLERDTRVSTIGAKAPESDRLFELYKKHSTTGLSLSEVNEVKRLYERNVKLDYLKENVADGVARANNIDSALRKFVEDKAAAGGFRNVRELNRETSLAKQLADDLGAEYAGVQGNNAITLTDWILLAEATNSPAAAAGFIGKKVFGNKRITSAVARALANNKGIKADVPAQTRQPTVNSYLEFIKSNQQPLAVAGAVGGTTYFSLDNNGNVVPAMAIGSIMSNPTARKQALRQLDDMIADRRKVALSPAASVSQKRAAEKAVKQLQRQKAQLSR